MIADIMNVINKEVTAFTWLLFYRDVADSLLTPSWMWGGHFAINPVPNISSKSFLPAEESDCLTEYEEDGMDTVREEDGAEAEEEEEEDDDDDDDSGGHCSAQ